MSPLRSRSYDRAPTDAFLGVERSARGRRWVPRLDTTGRNEALAIAQRTGLSDLISRVIVARGASADDAEAFLAPRLRDLMPNPATITDCEVAAERLALAARRREKIGVFGDYDVDGAASSALLARVMRALGCEVEIYIPDRITEGYGPNAAAMRGLRERGATLVVTVDCGTMSHETIAEAMAKSVDVLVLDHHQTGPELPAAVALVNPNRQDDVSGLGHMCATGVVFMVLVALRRMMGAGGFPNLLGELDLVALATVCDMVPLKGLNRAFVVQGLHVMRSGGNVGLAALARVARVRGKIEVGHLGFLLGPRINAGGRVGDASLGANLLTTSDETRALEISERLDGFNQERQAVEAEVLRSAEALAELEMTGRNPPAAIVAVGDGWHPGVVGLVASRLKDRFDRPAVAVGFDPAGRGTGSARSVPTFDIGAAIRRAAADGLLEKGGGHAMAAGLTIRRERLGEFRSFLEDAARDATAANHATMLEVDGAISSEAVGTAMVDDLERAGPYGVGHPQPLFVLPDQLVLNARVVGNGHVSLRLRGEDGAGVKAMAFKGANGPLGTLLLDAEGKRLHLAGTLMRDEYRGVTSAMVRIEDAAEPAI